MLLIFKYKNSSITTDLSAGGSLEIGKKKASSAILMKERNTRLQKKLMRPKGGSGWKTTIKYKKIETQI